MYYRLNSVWRYNYNKYFGQASLECTKVKCAALVQGYRSVQLWALVKSREHPELALSRLWIERLKPMIHVSISPWLSTHTHTKKKQWHRNINYLFARILPLQIRKGNLHINLISINYTISCFMHLESQDWATNHCFGKTMNWCRKKSNLASCLPIVPLVCCVSPQVLCLVGRRSQFSWKRKELPGGNSALALYPHPLKSTVQLPFRTVITVQ